MAASSRPAKHQISAPQHQSEEIGYDRWQVFPDRCRTAIYHSVLEPSLDKLYRTLQDDCGPQRVDRFGIEIK
jgi:hypothetical protein